MSQEVMNTSWKTINLVYFRGHWNMSSFIRPSWLGEGYGCNKWTFLFKSVLQKVPGTAKYNLCKVGLIYDLGALSCANGSHSRTKSTPERENTQDLPTENAASIDKSSSDPVAETVPTSGSRTTVGCSFFMFRSRVWGNLKFKWITHGRHVRNQIYSIDAWMITSLGNGCSG